MKKRMRDIKPLYYCYQVYKYSVFMPMLAASTIVLGVAGSLSMFVINSKTAFYFGVVWSRFCGYMTPISVNVHGIENIDRDQSYVIVANHQSQFDIFAVYGWLPLNFRWVMKHTLRKIPGLGWFCDKNGHVFIDRSNSANAIRSINEAKERIVDGISIIFFPEGKRNNGRELLEFKKGAYKFALDIDLPVLPVTIIGTSDILPNNSIKLFPGNVKIVIHEPISTMNYTEDSIHELMEKTRIIIQKCLNENEAHAMTLEEATA